MTNEAVDLPREREGVEEPEAVRQLRVYLIDRDGAEMDYLEVAEICAYADALLAQLEAVRKERDEAVELHRMQLVAISVASMLNTPKSFAKHRIGPDNPYWTVAYRDVCIAVNREMAERDRALAAESALQQGKSK